MWIFFNIWICIDKCICLCIYIHVFRLQIWLKLAYMLDTTTDDDTSKFDSSTYVWSDSFTRSTTHSHMFIYAIWPTYMCVIRLIYSSSHVGWNFRKALSKLKAQSSNVSSHGSVSKEAFELWALSFEIVFENVKPRGIGCTCDTTHSHICNFDSSTCVWPASFTWLIHIYLYAQTWLTYIFVIWLIYTRDTTHSYMFICTNKTRLYGCDRKLICMCDTTHSHNFISTNMTYSHVYDLTLSRVW